jgi:hypothetical protein
MYTKSLRRLRSPVWLVPTFGIVIGVIAGTAQPAMAGTPYEIDVSGKSLVFQLATTDDLEVGELPFRYVDILPELSPACLQAVVNAVSSTAVTTEDVDDANEGGATPGIFLDLEAAPAVSPVLTTAEARFSLDFEYDADCGGPTTPVPAQLLNLCIHTIDIDDYQFFGVMNPTSYTLKIDSVLSSSFSGGAATSAETNGIASSNPADQRFWAEFTFDSTNSVTFLAGIAPGGDDDAEFDVRFGCASWSGGRFTRQPGEAFAPDFNIDLDHYLNRSAETEETLPNTK